MSSVQNETGVRDVTPLISVVIPTYHRNDLLELCLERLAPEKQNLPPGTYDVVVSDDGKASTAEALIANKFPWARWIAGPRRGPGANRNHGVRHARGKWIAFTDDDCVPSTGWLAAFAQQIHDQPDAREVLEGKTTCEAGIRSIWEHAPINEEGGWLWSCNMMMPRTLFEEIGGFDEDFPVPHLEDVDLRERLRGLEIPIVWTPDAVVDHPPRPLAEQTLIKGHESEFLFYYKTGHTQSCAARHLNRLIRYRIRTALRPPLGKDNIRVVSCLIKEVANIMQHGRTWERIYKERYQNAAKLPKYSADLDAKMHY